MRLTRIASVLAVAFTAGFGLTAAAQADGYKRGPGYTGAYTPGYGDPSYGYRHGMRGPGYSGTYTPGYGNPSYGYRHDRRGYSYQGGYERPAPRYYQAPRYAPDATGRTYGGPSHESTLLGSPCYYDTLNGRVCI